MVKVLEGPVKISLSLNGSVYQLKVIPDSEEDALSVTSPLPQTESFTVSGFCGLGKTLKQALVSDVSGGMVARILTRKQLPPGKSGGNRV